MLDFFGFVVDYILGEYPMECMYCHNALYRVAFTYSEASDFRRKQLILDICCSTCGQMGQLELDFYRLDLLEIRGNFSLLPKRNNSARVREPLREEEVLKQVYGILRLAR